MNTFWSDTVQSPEELNLSRARRFREDNREQWLKVLGAREQMSALEVGCGPGLLCRRLKAWLPALRVTGLDRDSRHIAFARQQTETEGLDCTFLEGDALALPFADNRFDLCFSYTVMEHMEPHAFLREQRRVLKPGGRVVILSVFPQLSLHGERWLPADGEERALLDKAWAAAEKARQSLPTVCAYPQPPEAFGPLLAACGFREITLRFLVETDAPDSADTSPERALAAFEEERFAALSSLEKALRLAPQGLTEAEQARLRELIHRRFHRRVAAYRQGEKRWELSSLTILAAAGRKDGGGV